MKKYSAKQNSYLQQHQWKEQQKVTKTNSFMLLSDRQSLHSCVEQAKSYCNYSSFPHKLACILRENISHLFKVIQGNTTEGRRNIMRTWWNTLENFETNTVSEECPYVPTDIIKIRSSALEHHPSQNTGFLWHSNIHLLNYIHWNTFNITFYRSLVLVG